MLQGTAAGTPPAQQGLLSLLLGQLRRLDCVYQQKLLSLRQQHRPRPLLQPAPGGCGTAASSLAGGSSTGGGADSAASSGTGGGTDSAASSSTGGGANSAASSQHSSLLTGAWWQGGAFQGEKFLAQHGPPSCRPSAGGGSDAADTADGSAGKKSKSGGKGGKKPKKGKAAKKGSAASKTQSAAGGGDDGCQAATPATLLARLLAVPSPQQAAAQLARLGDRSCRLVFQLLCELPGGAQAAAALLQCLSPVVAVRWVPGLAWALRHCCAARRSRLLRRLTLPPGRCHHLTPAPPLHACRLAWGGMPDRSTALLPSAVRAKVLPHLAPMAAAQLSTVAAALAEAQRTRHRAVSAVVRRFLAASPLSCSQLQRVLEVVAGRDRDRLEVLVAAWGRIADPPGLAEVGATMQLLSHGGHLRRPLLLWCWCFELACMHVRQWQPCVYIVPTASSRQPSCCQI